MYTAVPAVVAGYPLLEALQACRRQAMAAEPGPGRAPFNRIAHSTRTWMHGDRDFNTPTVDLLYSNAWIDLRQGPVVLEIPARSRFFVVQLLDVHTENFFNLGTRNPVNGRLQGMRVDLSGALGLEPGSGALGWHASVALGYVTM